ncbi:MAG: cupin domain-containing protein [Myxococcota bacterium]|nr:cupin domain-containing protein [Myxococcota bacterium]
MIDVRELLPLHALGILDADEAGLVDGAVASDRALAAELAAYQDSASLLIDPVPPSPDVEARLLASVGGGRLEPFSARLAALFEVSVERARELLGLIERPASWSPQLPGIALVHFEGGAHYAAADCGFIRLDPGTVFPHHKHLGAEAIVILQGAVRDSVTGQRLGPGDELLQAEGSEHHLTCEGPDACIYAARAMNGISIGGVPARPSAPKL